MSAVWLPFLQPFLTFSLAGLIGISLHVEYARQLPLLFLEFWNWLYDLDHLHTCGLALLLLYTMMTFTLRIPLRPIGQYSGYYEVTLISVVLVAFLALCVSVAAQISASPLFGVGYFLCLLTIAWAKVLIALVSLVLFAIIRLIELLSRPEVQQLVAELFFKVRTLDQVQWITVLAKEQIVASCWIQVGIIFSVVFGILWCVYVWNAVRMLWRVLKKILQLTVNVATMSYKLIETSLTTFGVLTAGKHLYAVCMSHWVVFVKALCIVIILPMLLYWLSLISTWPWFAVLRADSVWIGPVSMCLCLSSMALSFIGVLYMLAFNMFEVLSINCSNRPWWCELDEFMFAMLKISDGRSFLRFVISREFLEIKALGQDNIDGGGPWKEVDSFS